jgi:hypothetical protein
MRPTEPYSRETWQQYEPYWRNECEFSDFQRFILHWTAEIGCLPFLCCVIVFSLAIWSAFLR